MFIRPGRRFLRMGFGPPMGILYLISALRNRYPNKYQFELIEQALYELSSEQVLKRFQKFDPDMVCFSAMSMEAGEMEEIARLVKKEKPNCITVLGGPHASIFYDWALKNSDIDYVVIGEGEETFPELLETLEQDKPLDQVKGIAFMRDGQLVLTEPRPFIEDLDSIPFPAWDMIDFDSYHGFLSMTGWVPPHRWAFLFTTRACPFKCAYCHCIFGKKVRKRSVENVIAEIELLVNQYGVKQLQIIDDIFNLDLERAKRICDEIVNRGIKVKIAFPNGLRADMMDRELIQKLKKAGCFSIAYAIESGSPRIQKLIHKNLDLEKARQVVEWTYQEGIITHAFTMIGFPSETREEMNQTLEYVLSSPFIRCWFFMVVVYPRTELLEIAKRSYPNFDFSGYEWFNFRYWSDVPFYTRATGVDLIKIQGDFYRRFFFRAKILFKVPFRYPKDLFTLKGIWWQIGAILEHMGVLDKWLKPLRKFIVKRLKLIPE